MGFSFQSFNSVVEFTHVYIFFHQASEALHEKIIKSHIRNANKQRKQNKNLIRNLLHIFLAKYFWQVYSF